MARRGFAAVMTGRALLEYRTDLEGLRGLAVLLVVAYHAQLPFVSGGYVGVDVFFVLSGYLITGLLLREFEKSGRISLLQFYARRTRRLLPAATVMLLATLWLGWFLLAPYEQQRFTGTAIATAAYASNVWFAKEATNYLASDTGANPLLHTWSLAVEEQFYIVWPLLLWATLKLGPAAGRRTRSVTIMLLIAAVSLGGCIWLTRFVQSLAFFASPTRAWEFAAGGLAWFATLPETISERYRSALSWAGLAAIVVSAFEFGPGTTFPGVAATLPVIGTAAVVSASSADAVQGGSKALATRPLIWLGRLSYSWYLWHWPLLLVGHTLHHDFSIGYRVAYAVVSLAIAWVTFRVIEHPIRASQRIAMRPRAWLAVAAGLTMVSVTTALWARQAARTAASTPQQRIFTSAWNDLPVLYSNGCHLGFFETRVQDCVYGAQGAMTRVVLFGDSHAAQWFPSLERLAEHQHWELRPMTKSGCPAASFEPLDGNLGRNYRECTAWRDAAIPRIIELRPALVVIASSSRYGAPFDTASRSLSWDAAIEDTLRRLSPSRAQIVLVRDVPLPGFDVPACLARATWNPRVYPGTCVFDRTSAVNEPVANAERAAVDRVSGTRYLDFTDLMCDAEHCQAERDGAMIYRDLDHVTTQFALQIMPEWERRLEER